MRTLTEKCTISELSRPPLTLGIAGPNSPHRRLLESCIAKSFDVAYGAQMRQFMPYLLNLRFADQPGAVVGIRRAADCPLFLEQYLAAPVEQETSRLFRAPVDRRQIVEIGNLAASVPGSAEKLFAALARVLQRAGFRWVACTATPQVETLLARLQFPSQTICLARPTALGATAGEWGTYYAAKPRVIVGDVRIAASRLAGDGYSSAMSRQFAEPIASIAAELKIAAQ